MNKRFLVFIVLLLGFSLHAQVKIGNNPTSINSSALLEMESTSKGFLPPRMTTTQRDAISNPIQGLEIYNISNSCSEYFNGVGWYNECNGTLSPLSGGNTSSGGTAVVSSWNSDEGCRVGAGTNSNPAGVRQGGVRQTMVQGTPASNVATIELKASVSTIGTYNIFTNAVNGVNFSASGTFTSTGVQTVILIANGTPTLAGNYIWTTNRTPSINIYGSVITSNAPLGSSYTNHFNGIVSGVHNTSNTSNPSYYTLSTYSVGEVFSSNTTCQNQPISAQGCAGITSVRGSSGRLYATVEINGQCWLQTNMNDVPSVYSNYTIGSWTINTPGDQGYWGYYHTSNTTGSSGWQSAEPASNEGLLYQWCAAMNATISERSKGVCPAGFHVPSDCEYMYLEHGQGMIISDQIALNWRSNSNINQGTPGNKLRSQGAGQTNASGFSGLLSGLRINNIAIPDMFGSRSNSCFLWLSSAVSGVSSASTRSLATGYFGVNRTNWNKGYGLSLRCLKD